MKRPVFDFRNPDYGAEFRWRVDRLRALRADPQTWHILRAYYRENPAAMIDDWGMTYDPRNVERGLPPLIPFRMFERQKELADWIVTKWRKQEHGVVPKSRDIGASWVAVALSCCLCELHDGMAIGFGSRKEEYVDKLGSTKALFSKARVFIKNLPIELRGGWDEKKHAPYMRLMFPGTGSLIEGEAGDNIGRGDRKGLYFGDEAAHWLRPDLIEASLSQTTNCRIDMSSVNGMNNPFANKAHAWPDERVFYFHWRDDPRKDDAWYEKQKEQILDPIVIAQEIDISWTASLSGVVIPQEWVQAAINADVKLGLTVTGARIGGFDVADQGPDLNSFAGRHGIRLEYCEAWSGDGADIFSSVKRVFEICERERYGQFAYDEDGLGAGVRGDARVLSQYLQSDVIFSPYRGSGAVVNPTDPIPTIDNGADSDSGGRTNEDYFQNYKGQAWWDLRARFMRTYRAVVQGKGFTSADDLISISPHIPDLKQLCAELSQAVYKKSGAGKMLIDKQPDGTRSPNRADAIVIAYAPRPVEPRGFFDM